jgi:prevent-host-death family protein
MKVIPLSEAKAHLSRYGDLCQEEPVVVTVNGVPSFQLVPLENDDGLVEQLIERNPAFRELLKRRLDERNISVKSALRRL